MRASFIQSYKFQLLLDNVYEANYILQSLIVL